MASLAQQRNSAGSCEWLQCCRAIQTTGVPDISSPMKNFTPVKFMLAVAAYLWHP